ncbi:hypothetical protein [Geobacillus sp. 46C-IIa]|uniref:hypothetical protein n=1 Tax=Geobacillus sp. 46C-IIa TaxID=1963025 RepID=UPI001CC20F1F|nr:hypothetical protein [Geobacillus sp. 46C-IIa]
MAAGFAMDLIQPFTVFLVTERLGMEESDLQWLFAAHGAAMMIGGGMADGPLPSNRASRFDDAQDEGPCRR